MEWIQTYTTATTPDSSWDGMDIWVNYVLWETYQSVEGSKDFRETVEMGIDQGWIVLINPYVKEE